MTDKPKVFFPQYSKGKSGFEILKGKTISEHARKYGIEIASECGGGGQCGKCVVRIEEGLPALNRRTKAEESFNLGKGERLACQARVVKPFNISVFTKEIGRYAILSDTKEDKIKINPFVYRRGKEVFWRGEGGEQRLLGKYKGKMLGLAIDVGTTTLVSQVVDLQSGEEVATLAVKNPQAAYGDDVISRISYTMNNKNGLKELQAVVVGAVNESLARLAVHGPGSRVQSPERQESQGVKESRKSKSQGVKESRSQGVRSQESGVNSQQSIVNGQQSTVHSEEIYEAVVVGNSTMRSLFFGVDVLRLGVIPYEPTRKEPISVKAGELGLNINPQANVYGAALIGGHAGADCLADILIAGPHKRKRPSMVVDIGTNGEVAIGSKEKILTVSCAAGGAYEGAAVSSGMGAVEGAIKNIKIKQGKVRYETIGNKKAIGICGSGLIDLLAELLKSEIMTDKARLKRDFLVSNGIKISQADVYQLITAKAGLRLDQDLLIRYFGTTLEEIEKVYLAGAFGNYINVDSAIAIGLLPEVRGKVVKIGNGALAGARQMLLSKRRRWEAERLSQQIQHIKPNEYEKDFVHLLAERMYFRESPNAKIQMSNQDPEDLKDF